MPVDLLFWNASLKTRPHCVGYVDHHGKIDFVSLSSWPSVRREAHGNTRFPLSSSSVLIIDWIRRIRRAVQIRNNIYRLNNGWFFYILLCRYVCSKEERQLLTERTTGLFDDDGGRCVTIVLALCVCVQRLVDWWRGRRVLTFTPFSARSFNSLAQWELGGRGGRNVRKIP